jgi:hypothetical protein
LLISSLFWETWGREGGEEFRHKKDYILPLLAITDVSVLATLFRAMPVT